VAGSAASNPTGPSLGSLLPGAELPARWALAVSLALLAVTPWWWIGGRPDPNVGRPPWSGPGNRAEAARPDPAEAPAPTIGVSSLRFSDLEPVPAGPRPLRLDIPALGVRAPIIPVGIRAAGAMEVPRDVATVGWYRFGPSPGRTGSALLVGHVDSRVQGAGVFYRLSEAEPGAVVRVRLSGGQSETFEVVSRSLVPKDRLPRPIFARNGDPMLTLVTCGGSFDRAAGAYTHNVLVGAVPRA
jgi:sortase (surface protein transpeptidase)